MRNVSAELVDVEGENSVMRAFRDNAVPELPPQNIVIPITTEQIEASELWIPISFEDPIHLSIDKRYDQHNVMNEDERPQRREIWEPLTPEHRKWLEGIRLTMTTTYTLMGTVAATDLHINPSIRPKDINTKELKKLNHSFNELMGEWGGLLCATIEYVSISGGLMRFDENRQTFTYASLLIIESESEFLENQGKNPAEIFENFS